MRAVRIYHSGVVAAWRARDRVLRGRGVDLALVTARSWNEGGRAVQVRPSPDEPWVVSARTFGRHPYRFAYDPRPLWRLVRAGDIDVLDVHEEPASLAVAEVLLLVALAGRGRPALCLYSAQNIHKRYPVPFRWLERLALDRATAVHTCNEAAGEVLRRKGFTGLVRNLGLGVDIERFRPAARAGRGAGVPLRVGYVGRLEAHKGVTGLVEAVAATPGIELVVVGDGPLRQDLDDMVTWLRLGGRVTLRGFAAHDDLPELYRGLDVLAVPSLDTPSWVEQFGRVAVEAMASGVAVVASDSGALPEVVGEAGLLVPPGSVDALADALAGLRDDADLLRRLQEAAPIRAANFSWDEVAGRHLALYEEMVW